MTVETSYKSTETNVLNLDDYKVCQQWRLIVDNWYEIIPNSEFTLFKAPSLEAFFENLKNMKENGERLPTVTFSKTVDKADAKEISKKLSSIYNYGASRVDNAITNEDL